MFIIKFYDKNGKVLYHDFYNSFELAKYDFYDYIDKKTDLIDLFDYYKIELSRVFPKIVYEEVKFDE